MRSPTAAPSTCTSGSRTVLTRANCSVSDTALRTMSSSAGPDRLDDPGALVTADDGIPRRIAVDAAGQVEIGVAQAGGGELDLHLPDTWLVDVEFDDLELLASLFQNCSASLH